MSARVAVARNPRTPAAETQLGVKLWVLQVEEE